MTYSFLFAQTSIRLSISACPPASFPVRLAWPSSYERRKLDQRLRKHARIHTSATHAPTSILQACRLIPAEATPIFFRHTQLILHAEQIPWLVTFSMNLLYSHFLSRDLTSRFTRRLLSQIRSLRLDASLVDTRALSRLPALETLELHPHDDEARHALWVDFDVLEGSSLAELHKMEGQPLAGLVPAIKAECLLHDAARVYASLRGALRGLVEMERRVFRIRMAAPMELFADGEDVCLTMIVEFDWDTGEFYGRTCVRRECWFCEDEMWEADWVAAKLGGDGDPGTLSTCGHVF